MHDIQNLLILYAGIVLINVVVSAILWFRQKNLLAKKLFIIWAATFAVYVLQGTLTQNILFIVIGFAFTYFINTSISEFIDTLTGHKTKWIYFHSITIFSCLLAMFLYFMKVNSFLLIALPVTLAVAFPLVYTHVTCLRYYWKTMTFSGKALVIICLFFAIHNIDFAFLRMIDSAAPFGFTVATLLIFALSLFAPSVVIETVTMEKARVSAEIDVAQRIQTEILPKSPSIPGYELATCMIPADEVGGDYYDIHIFEDCSWVLLGDVTGHGLGSGLVMFMIQSIMSSILQTKHTISPSELNYIANMILFNNLERLNEKRPTTIVSLCLKEDKAIFSGCHDNIYLYRANTKDVEVIEMDMFPLGLGFISDLSLEVFDEKELCLSENDLLFIGTDGITEAFQKGKTETVCYSEERLLDIIQKNGDQSLETIKTRLLDDLNGFTGGYYKDDLTFLMLRMKG